MARRTFTFPLLFAFLTPSVSILPGPEVHIGVQCDGCDMFPIVGTRYKVGKSSNVMGTRTCVTFVPYLFLWCFVERLACSLLHILVQFLSICPMSCFDFFWRSRALQFNFLKISIVFLITSSIPIPICQLSDHFPVHGVLRLWPVREVRGCRCPW